MTKIIDLYWFSGTGNSLFVAKKIRDKLNLLGYECSLLPIEMVDSNSISKDNTIGIIVPVAMQGTFPLVWNFIKDLPIVNNTQIFLVDTLHAYSGGIKGPIKKIVTKKGFKPIGAIEIIMPNLFLKIKKNIYDTKKIKKAIINIDNFCEKLHTNKTHWNDIPIYSALLSKIYDDQMKVRKWLGIFPKNITDKCINCGICVRLCPKKCIDIYSKHIKEKSEECILCQRCLEYCPVNAIEIRGHKFIKNMLISLNDMIKSLQIDI